MTTFTEAAAGLRKAAADMPKAVQTGVAEATALLTAAVTVGQARAGASSGRLRGVGTTGGPIGVKGTVRGGTGLVRATGAAHLLDHPTKAHTITAKHGAVLATPFGPRQAVKHPGTKGKPYFEEAVAETAPKVRGIIERHVAERALKEL